MNAKVGIPADILIESVQDALEKSYNVMLNRQKISYRFVNLDPSRGVCSAWFRDLHMLISQRTYILFFCALAILPSAGCQGVPKLLNFQRKFHFSADGGPERTATGHSCIRGSVKARSKSWSQCPFKN